MVGALSAKTLDAKVDINGTTFKDASARVGSGGSSHEVRAMSPLCSALLLWHRVLEEVGACGGSLPCLDGSLTAVKLLMPGPRQPAAC